MSTNIFQTLAKLKALYPEDIERIEEDVVRVKLILEKKNFAENGGTKELLSVCRKDILTAKKKLATDKGLLGKEAEQRELWFIIESRQWTIDMISRDYDGELKSIERELEAELNI